MAARLQRDCEYTTRLWQGCDKVARTPQPCHHLVISVWVVNLVVNFHDEAFGIDHSS